MRPKVFHDFSEVEADIRKKAPPTVYKYRFWKDNFHKAVLINQAVWFSHPFDLNDPLDVRPETVFDENQFYDNRYFQRMLKGADAQFPKYTKYQRFLAAMEQWNEIKASPKIVTDNMIQWNSERGNFDSVGVFSTCSNGINVRMWNEYGDGNRGFCIGFKTIEFCKQMNSGYGIVRYTDAPYLHNFLGVDGTDYDELHEIDPLYTKKEIWSHEEEFRFITVGIGKGVSQLQNFNTSTVAEIILGCDISISDQEEIIQIVKDKYTPTIPVFKIQKSASSSLAKIQIN